MSAFDAVVGSVFRGNLPFLCPLEQSVDDIDIHQLVVTPLVVPLCFPCTHTVDEIWNKISSSNLGPFVTGVCRVSVGLLLIEFDSHESVLAHVTQLWQDLKQILPQELQRSLHMSFANSRHIPKLRKMAQSQISSSNTWNSLGDHQDIDQYYLCNMSLRNLKFPRDDVMLIDRWFRHPTHISHSKPSSAPRRWKSTDDLVLKYIIEDTQDHAMSLAFIKGRILHQFKRQVIVDRKDLAPDTTLSSVEISSWPKNLMINTEHDFFLPSKTFSWPPQREFPVSFLHSGFLYFDIFPLISRL